MQETFIFKCFVNERQISVCRCEQPNASEDSSIYAKSRGKAEAIVSNV